SSHYLVVYSSTSPRWVQQSLHQVFTYSFGIRYLGSAGNHDRSITSQKRCLLLFYIAEPRNIDAPGRIFTICTIIQMSFIFSTDIGTVVMKGQIPAQYTRTVAQTCGICP